VKEATPGAENKNQSSSDRYVAESVSNEFGSLDYDYLESSENQNPVFISGLSTRHLGFAAFRRGAE